MSEQLGDSTPLPERATEARADQFAEDTRILVSEFEGAGANYEQIEDGLMAAILAARPPENGSSGFYLKGVRLDRIVSITLDGRRWIDVVEVRRRMAPSGMVFFACRVRGFEKQPKGLRTDAWLHVSTVHVVAVQSRALEDD